MATQNVCSRCAQSGKTCCQETDIYLTVGDIKRIAGYIARLDFYEYRRPLDPLYLDQNDDPDWGRQTIRSDGTRRVLKQKEGRDCLFLQENGCLLATAVRPLVCRLHPYTYTRGGLAGILDQRCLAARQQSLEMLPAEFGMSYVQAQAWHLQLYNEIFVHEGIECNEDWHHLRPAV